MSVTVAGANNSMQRTALRAVADADRYADKTRISAGRETHDKGMELA